MSKERPASIKAYICDGYNKSLEYVSVSTSNKKYVEVKPLHDGNIAIQIESQVAIFDKSQAEDLIEAISLGL